MKSGKALAGWVLTLIQLLTVCVAAQQIPPALHHNQSSNQRVQANYANLPLTFEANQGQTDLRARFLSKSAGYSVYLTSGGMVLSLHPSSAANRQRVAAMRSSNTQKNATLVFNLVGAAAHPQIVGEEQQPGVVNYFIGSNPKKWRTNVPTFARLRYKNVYPGIDLVYYGNHRQMEYDFVAAPGADPSKIKFEIKGARQMTVDNRGDLVLGTNNGDLHFQSPVVYQESNGKRTRLQGGYVVDDQTHVRFNLERHDSSRALVIDPVLVYSTYVGGSSDDFIAAVAVDNSGSAYVTGYTQSTDLPLGDPSALSPGGLHAFVTKLDATGSSVVYTDYLGGDSFDFGFGIAVDSSNAVYVTGATCSDDFPTVNPIQASLRSCSNAFMTKIAASGASLVYSTYLGGTGSDRATGIALDANGEAIIAGNTTSTDFPTASAYQSTVAPNESSTYGTYGFVTKFSADGSSLIYSTYLAGSSNASTAPYSQISGVAVDADGNAYVAGNTNTYNFPTTPGAFQTSNTSANDQETGFVSKLSAAGGLGYSTYFGGSWINVSAIAVDDSGAAYFTGQANADGTFPLTSTSICNPTVSGTACAPGFVAKLNAAGTGLSYSTFLGHDNAAFPTAIAVDPSGNAFVLAYGGSSSFETVNGLQAFAGESDLMLVTVDSGATSELFATNLGGSGAEVSGGLALDANGAAYVTGYTDSTDFPVTSSAVQNTAAGGMDAVVAKISVDLAPAVAFSPAQLQFASQEVGTQSQPQSVVLHNTGSAPLTISSISPSGDFTETNDCGSSVPAGGSCTITVTFTPQADGTRNGSIQVQDDAAGSPHVISLTGEGTGATAPTATASPSALSFSSQLVGTTSAAQTITLTNDGTTAITVSSVVVSGNFGQTNNCTTIAANSSCTISVTFTPAASGTRNGTITITDSASNSPQVVSLSGSGLDFRVTANTTSTTIAAGATATYQLTVASVGGSFTNAIAMACSGAPAHATCSVSPSSVTPGNGSTTVTVTVTTTATTASLSMPATGNSQQQQPMFATIWMMPQGLGAFGMVLFGGVDRRKHRLQKRYVLLAILIVATVLLAGCAGGTAFTSPSSPGTPAGTYTLTVTGTSGSLQHATSLTLTVQ